MTATAESLEKRRLMRLAREYRDRGYAVVLHPKPEELPSFLAELQPDMIALSERESVVIEVRSRQSLRDESHTLEKLAEAVDAHSGWRFELVVTNPRAEGNEPPHGTEPDLWEIRSRIGVARELLAEGQAELAALIASSALEAVLRRVARVHDVTLDRLQPDYVAKQLYVLGLLPDDDFELMQLAMHERTLIAHGFRSSSPAEEWVPVLLESASRLISEW